MTEYLILNHLWGTDMHLLWFQSQGSNGHRASVRQHPFGSDISQRKTEKTEKVALLLYIRTGRMAEFIFYWSPSTSNSIAKSLTNYWVRVFMTWGCLQLYNLEGTKFLTHELSYSSDRAVNSEKMARMWQLAGTPFRTRLISCCVQHSHPRVRETWGEGSLCKDHWSVVCSQPSSVSSSNTEVYKWSKFLEGIEP